MDEMKKRPCETQEWLVSLDLGFFTIPVFADAIEGQGTGTPITVSVVVTKMQSGMIFVKTPRGQVMFASTVLVGLQVGERCR